MIESDANSIIALSSGLTVDTVRFARSGNTASLLLIIKVGTTLAAGNVTIGTLKPGYRPAITAPLPSFGKATYLPYVEASGDVKLNIVNAVTSGKLYIGGTYVLP